MIKAVLSFLACALFISGFWISNSVAGDNNEVYHIWRMNLMSLNFLLLCVCLLLKTSQNSLSGAFTNWFIITHLLYCVCDMWERSFHIYEFRHFDVYAIMFIPIISAGLYVTIHYTKVREIFRQ